MSRWFRAILLVGAIFIPASARAQTPITLSSLQVQLWPEYDQPSMLVIYDLQPAAGTELPVGVTIKFPKAANLVAVAVQGSDGSLLNADYLESAGDTAWQSVIIQVQSASVYRMEYYQPLTRSGNIREFSYQWPGDYAVQNLAVSLRLPADAVDVSVDPSLPNSQTAGSTTLLGGTFGPLVAGNPFALHLHYARNSEALSAEQQDLQPTQPLGGDTAGRVMLSNYLPYMLGALGVVLLVGGTAYFWQATRGRGSREKRHVGRAQNLTAQAGDVYCPQCGTRAQPSDRFCRVCGTRLRPPE